MMERANRILTGLVIVQLLLIAAVWTLNVTREESPGGKLLTFDPQAIDRIEVASQGQGAIIARNDDQWLLPQHHGLPVTESRVSSLLSTLHSVEAGWPVATSASAAERFEVDDGNFQRHVKLLSGDTVQAEFWLGTSPGFRKIHARRAGDDAVYAVELALHEMPDNPDNWFDKSLLAIEGDIEAVHATGFGVERVDDSWQFAPPHADAGADSDAIKRWVSRFGSLTVGDALPADAEPGTLEREFKVRTATTTEILKIFKADDVFRISGSQHDGVFELPSWVADPLLEANRESLAAAAETDDSGAATESTATETRAQP